VVPGIVKDPVSFEEMPVHARNVMTRVEPRLRAWRCLTRRGGGGVWWGHPWTALAPAGKAVTWLVGGTASIQRIVALVVPALAFYSQRLRPDDHVDPRSAPFRYRPFVVDVAREVDEVLGQFIRGQLIAC
jgi:hypothetical protein